MIFVEGGDGDGEELRKEKGVPESEAARKKWFLNEANRKTWEFEAGRTHWGDFFNPYLDFNRMSLEFITYFSTLSKTPITDNYITEFALNLPGFSLPIMKYWDGQSLR